MNGEQLDVDAMIADLEAKKAAIENAIMALRAIYPAEPSLGTILAGGPPASGKAVDPERIPTDAFFGMRSLAEAAKKYLSLVKRKQTTKEIVQALERGGFPHQSKSLYSTLYTALQREEEREGGDIVRIGSEWAIASWYPGRGRRPKVGNEKQQEPEPKLAPTGTRIKAIGQRLKKMPRKKRRRRVRQAVEALKALPERHEVGAS